MKRLLLISTVTLLLVIVVGGSAFATLARIRALGNQEFYFKDIYHVYTNPAYLGLYTNNVYGELGTYTGQFSNPDSQFVGISYKLYKGLSLGLTLNRQAFWDPTDKFTEYDFFGFPTPINGYDVMGSYDFEKLHFGVDFYHAGNKYEQTISNGASSKTEYSSGTTTLTGGFLFDLTEMNSVEGVLRLNFDRAKTSSTSGSVFDKNETDGGNGIAFGARGFFEVSTDFQVVPLFAFAHESVSLKHTEDVSANNYTTGKMTETLLFFGLGGNLQLEKGMVAGGLNLTMTQEKDEKDPTSTTETKDWYMPGFNLGVEYELVKWLTARIGMEKWFGKRESKLDTTLPFHRNTKTRFANSDESFVGAGVGFKFSKFQVDATVGDNSLFEGGYILSGVQRNLFGTLSAVFTF